MRANMFRDKFTWGPNDRSSLFNCSSTENETLSDLWQDSTFFCHPLSSQTGKSSLTVQTHLNSTLPRDKADDSGQDGESHQVWLGTVATVVLSVAPDWSKRKRISQGVYFSSQQKRPSLMVLDMLPFWRHRVVLTWPVFPFSSLSSPLSLTQELGGACKVSSHTLCYKNNPGFIGIAMGGWHVGEGVGVEG